MPAPPLPVGTTSALVPPPPPAPLRRRRSSAPPVLISPLGASAASPRRHGRPVAVSTLDATAASRRHHGRPGTVMALVWAPRPAQAGAGLGHERGFVKVAADPFYDEEEKGAGSLLQRRRTCRGRSVARPPCRTTILTGPCQIRCSTSWCSVAS